MIYTCQICMYVMWFGFSATLAVMPTYCSSSMNSPATSCPGPPMVWGNCDELRRYVSLTRKSPNKGELLKICIWIKGLICHFCPVLRSHCIMTIMKQVDLSGSESVPVHKVFKGWSNKNIMCTVCTLPWSWLLNPNYITTFYVSPRPLLCLSFPSLSMSFK